INCADKFSLSPLGDDPVAYVPCCVLRSPPIKPDESYKALVFHSQPTPSSNVLGLCYTLMGHLDVQLYMSALQRSLEDANRAEV
ncbi:hypothetical protein KY318_03400, partial [Candidatus Woesearchaeota archaeon]|nr:hypothetical protein [Candidatus Woesearchaeota archaeon]